MGSSRALRSDADDLWGDGQKISLIKQIIQARALGRRAQEAVQSPPNEAMDIPPSPPPLKGPERPKAHVSRYRYRSRSCFETRGTTRSVAKHSTYSWVESVFTVIGQVSVTFPFPHGGHARDEARMSGNQGSTVGEGGRDGKQETGSTRRKKCTEKKDRKNTLFIASVW